MYFKIMAWSLAFVVLQLYGLGLNQYVLCFEGNGSFYLEFSADQHCCGHDEKSRSAALEADADCHDCEDYTLSSTSELKKSSKSDWSFGKGLKSTGNQVRPAPELSYAGSFYRQAFVPSNAQIIHRTHVLLI